MKRIIAIFILFLLSARGIQNIYVLAYYEIHKEYISANLCVNRSKPITRCHGHCYLERELNNEENRDQPEKINQAIRLEFIGPVQFITGLPWKTIPLKGIHVVISFLYPLFFGEIFHPPTIPFCS